MSVEWAIGLGVGGALVCALLIWAIRGALGR